MQTILGVHFLWGRGGVLKPWSNKAENSREKFAGRIRWEFAACGLAAERIRRENLPIDNVFGPLTMPL